MAGHRLADGRRLSREELFAELERAREHIAELEADRTQPHQRLINSLAQHLQDGFSLLSPQGVHLDVNPALCAMLGYTYEELIGVGLPHPYWPPEEKESITRGMRRHLEGATGSLEATFVRMNGERFPVLITPSVISDAAGEPVCIFATIKDISEQKRAEEALQVSEERYRGLVDGMLEGLAYCRMIFDTAGRPLDWLYLAVNPAFERLTGLQGAAGKTISELLPQAREETPELFESYGRVAAGGPAEEFEIDFTPLGRVFHVSAFCPASGHFVAVFEDVTESRRVAQENALLKRSIDVHRDGAYWAGTDDRFVYVNDAACAMVGYEREELLGKPLSLVNTEATPEGLAWVWEQLRTNGSLTAESVHRRKDGAEFPVEITASYVNFAGKEYQCGFAHDISERRRLEDARRESAAHYRSLFEDSPVAMWEQDDSAVKAHLEDLAAAGVDDVIAFLLADPQEYARCIELSQTLDANKAAVRLFGAGSREELLARNSDLYRRESDCGIYRFWAAMLAGECAATFEEANLSLTGNEVQVLETCTVVPGHEETFDRVYIADVDITERKRAEEALREGEARLQRALSDTIAALGATVAMRDPYTADHERRVAWLACRIAERLGWSAAAIETLRTAALVHDVGKIAVPAEILSKPTRLSETEFALVKAHAVAASDILAPIDFGGPVAQIVAQHHERLDGSGYPHGLRGDAILPGARVLAVADVVEAMITHRPYRPALSVEEALVEIGPESRGRFDTQAAEVCRGLFGDEGFTLPE